MATLVFLHAHPDDESSSTAGTMARAAVRGDRVILVVATDGACGEEALDADPHETVAARRHRELEASAKVLGVSRVEWLGYHDSGMTGWPQNHAPGSFMDSDAEEAGRRLADILDEEDADALIGYDWHGNYGHPDHVMVHHVTWSAVEQAARRPRVLEVSINRERQAKAAQLARSRGLTQKMPDPVYPGDDGNPIGTPEADLRWAVDVRDLAEVKRAALKCHASQTSDITAFTSLPDDIFAEVFGWECYREPSVEGPVKVAWPFDGAPWPGTPSRCTCADEGRPMPGDAPDTRPEDAVGPGDPGDPGSLVDRQVSDPGAPGVQGHAVDSAARHS
ncbi:PIG-L deacetylase family protein [Acidipropionibacterium jensenii]|uniref:PIG-L deacetylase family protein n=1 Tax=Acidipropionibacterium jensenii TaxID=1749 RepID=UPI000BC2CC8C|nr:PIG-L family deacetylase [Acidipropionibacterium jensenii]